MLNRLNFGLSLLFIAGLAFAGFLYLQGEETDQATDYEAPVAESAGSDEPEEEPTEAEPLEDDAPDAGLIENAGLRTNAAGIAIIKEYEGLELEAYEGAGGWHIGYGHGSDVEPGQTITEAEAEEFLVEDLTLIENEIRAAVTLPLNENEFSALVSLAYNIGTTAFRNSTVLEELNAGNRDAAADAFLMWNKMSQDGQIVQNMSLTDRREAERTLFLTPTGGLSAAPESDSDDG